MAAKKKSIRITQIRSVIGSKPKHRRTIQALGFKRMQQTVEHSTTPVILGMVQSVRHLVKVEEIS